MSNETVGEWFNRALTFAAETERPIGLPKQNRWHRLRYARRTELRKVETKYGRFLLDHSINAGTPGIEVPEGRYLGLVPEDRVPRRRSARADPVPFMPRTVWQMA